MIAPSFFYRRVCNELIQGGSQNCFRDLVRSYNRLVPEGSHKRYRRKSKYKMLSGDESVHETIEFIKGGQCFRHSSSLATWSTHTSDNPRVMTTTSDSSKLRRAFARRPSVATKCRFSVVNHRFGTGLNSPNAQRMCCTITKIFSKDKASDRRRFVSQCGSSSFGSCHSLKPCAAKNWIKYSAKQLPKAITLVFWVISFLSGTQPRMTSSIVSGRS